MLKSSDLLLLLTELDEKGVDTTPYITKVTTSPNIDLDTLKFINANRQLDVTKFYEKLRHSYNNKKSKLYINIVKDEINPKECLTTLASLNLQILLFSEAAENKEMFLSHSRAEEITRVLNHYYKTYDLIPCYKLLKLIRADLFALESSIGRR